jgi:eukaryotic-like serine/threonine-protein kinase
MPARRVQGRITLGSCHLPSDLSTSDSSPSAVTRDAIPLSRYVEGEIIADKYKLISKLGSGGMGSLWVAKNLQLDAPVALKLIRADVASKELEERFLTEARTLARLRHPNIVRVFDFGRTRHEDPYIVMELLHGETLGGLLDRNARLPAARTLQLMLPIVDALVAAHAKNVVHRDIKPDNVFLADDDLRLQPKLLDFGIAKSTTGLEDKKLTQAGTIVGSPEYLSPEQARGADDVDYRTDIWSLSVVIYECLTGQLPFEANNYNSLLRAIIEDEPSPLSELGAGDAELWELLKLGLEKKPEHRYQRARDLGVALAAWLYAHGIEEDACGQSLRATWLEGELGRSSSGRVAVGTVPRGTAHSASTLPNGMASTPAPVVTPPKRNRSLVYALGATALVLIAVVTWLSLRAPTVEATVATPAPPAAPGATIIVQPGPPKAEPVTPPLVSERAEKPARGAPRTQVPPAKPRASASAGPKSPDKPKPYTEDLGF